MLTRGDKIVLGSMLLYSVCLWGFFLTVFFGFHDVFTLTTGGFMDLPVQERELLRQNIQNYETLSMVIIGVVLFSFLAYMCGTYYLFESAPASGQAPLLSMGKWGKSAVSWGSGLVLLGLAVYMKFGVERCYLWMELIPAMLLSVEFLLSAAVGVHRRRQIQDPA